MTKPPLAIRTSDRFTRTRFHNIHGAVIVYTPRHNTGCDRTDRNDNSCLCPKWIYSKPRRGKALQKAAGTPDFSEAAAEAQRILRGFDPEIRQAREQIAQQASGIEIEAALAEYQIVIARRDLAPTYKHVCMQLFLRRSKTQLKGRALIKNPTFLEFLDKRNAGERYPITRMNQITPMLLNDWAATWKTNDLSSKTWRALTAAFFKWAEGRDYFDKKVRPKFTEKLRVRPGNRCGSFTPEQFQRMIEACPFYDTKYQKLASTYGVRLRAFIELGRWGGMADCDIVRFTPRENLTDQNVLTYARRKNGQVAVVLLAPDVARRLRAIPPEPGSSEEQPMRFPAVSESANGVMWRQRFQKICTFAKIGKITTKIGTVRDPNPHMLRDTFAIDAILRGVPLEIVSQMLGHASSAVTEKNYLFWTKQRVDHSVEVQRAALAGSRPVLVGTSAAAPKVLHGDRRMVN
jgi:integrase